jgi:uncharacterized caspase-like protein
MKKQLLISFIIICFCVKNIKAYENTYIVIVAVADYKHFTYASGDLRYPLNDANSFASFFMLDKGENVPSENIYMLTNEKAKKANILFYTKKMFERAKTNDRVIFYYSGHGSSGSFLPYDATSFGSNRLCFSEVKELFKHAKCNTKLLFADACYSGSLKDFPSKKSQKPLNKNNNSYSFANIDIAVMLSSQDDEVSVEHPSIKKGLFTYVLIKGLTGKADEDNDGIITIKELFYYVYEKTVLISREIGQQQSPILFGDFDMDLVVGKVY